MKLLFDQNLSFRLASELADLFPDSRHVMGLGLDHADDQALWRFAKENGFTLISKDSDFHQRSFVYGQPSKFIRVRAGNCSTEQVAALLRGQVSLILEFANDPELAFLILPRERR
ncbi:MAG: DUF5615 family PIN-like protein [Acidobacteriales bacterium]|nr:DUF5615 family PIN-like protein [Terriglobales bacterium]